MGSAVLGVGADLHGETFVLMSVEPALSSKQLGGDDVKRLREGGE